jgi:N-methylhydantoinase A
MGGTFTDAVVDYDNGRLTVAKASTTPADPAVGVFDALARAASQLGMSAESLISQTDMLIHGTTHAINAVLTGRTARTAFLTTRGHPDILVFREGGRGFPFNWTIEYPEPYVPRSLTFEVPERIDASGAVIVPLDEGAVIKILERLDAKGVAAVAVCLLWSTLNPKHELRIAKLMDQNVPDLPYTLSHQLNPTLREYRRACSTCVDASLKPVMSDYIHNLSSRLTQAGFSGRLLMVTSTGGVLDAAMVARAPIHAIRSGPALGPRAGNHYAKLDGGSEIAIVTDAGGTSYDISVVRHDHVSRTRETWLGTPHLSDITGFASVDVRSIGSGGGSIAWVDDGGLLNVGPASAGSVPGPACYGLGGTQPTVTDAAVVLGYIDPNYFLGGARRLDAEAATRVVSDQIAERMGLELHAAAAAILKVSTENMVRAVEDMTIYQGIDPREAVLVGGGGAAGLNAVAIARRLGCVRVVVPEIGPVLSAAGALMSDLISEYAHTLHTTSQRFDFKGVNAVLDDLRSSCVRFAEESGAGSVATHIELFADVRYPHQIWELEVPLSRDRFDEPGDVIDLAEAFHVAHGEVFAVSDRESPIEIISWRARVTC